MASTVLCGQCGAQGDPDDRFCGSCGADRSAAEKPAPEPAVVAPAPPAPRVVNPVVKQAAPPAKAAAPPVKAAPTKAKIPAASVLGAERDHLVGETVPNTTYLGMRLIYEKPPEPTFDPAYSPPMFWEILRYWLIFFGMWAFVGFVLFWFFLLVTVVTKSPAAIGLYFFGAAISGVALFVIWLLRPLPAKLSEWKLSVDDKGAAETTAFEHITWAFRRRETPVDSLRVRRISQPSAPSRDYIEVREGHFTGYISCFAYGEDLYIGWTLWLVLAPWRYFLLILVRVYHMVTLRATGLLVTLRYENVRAMREAMHAACREGVDVAAGDLEPRGHGIVGSEVAVDLTTLTFTD
jgi:hypothetical protein